MEAGGQQRRTGPAPAWVRYAVAVGAVAAGALLRELLFHVPPLADLARQSPFSFLYPAVMAAALYGGNGPGICAAVLALLLVATHLGPDGTEIGMPHRHDAPRLVLFVIVNALILLICNRVHRARRALKQTLAAREASERRVTNTLEHITDAFFSVDRDFRFTFVNRQCEAFYGKRREDLLGRKFFDVFPEHVGGPVEVGARKAMTEQVPVHEEFFSPVAQRWVEGDVYPTPDGLSAYFRDVTERHAAREALRESEARYRRLVETAQEGICQIDAAGKVTYANRAMGRMLGLAPEAVAGKLLTEFVEGELTGPVERPAGAAALLQEARLRRADGSTFLAQISTSPLYREDAEYLGELAVVTDVTERRAIETERQELLRREQRARADAEAAIRRKDQFLAILSHELRTPLTPVIARLALLRRDPSLGATAKNGLEMIRRNVALEARLIDDLLDITRLSRGQLKLDLTPVDAHQTLRDALEIYEHEIERRQQRVEIDLSAAQHTVRADAVRLQQVFWNLIGNAVKYTPEGGTIRLRSSNPPTGIGGGDGSPRGAQPLLRVDITDTGIGIEPEVMPRIFDPFEQGEQTLTRRYGGLGLGLSISRTLVQMHGGTLTASSAGRGEGATFTIELPTVAAPAEAEAPPAEREPEVKLASPAPAAPQRATVQRILLVDDNEDTLRVMARLLRLSGHQVITADTMATALHAAAQPFDLLITDIGLPDGTGWDLMRTLCQRGPVRGIAISGFSMTDDVTRSNEVGFLQHLSKPVNPEELEQAIRRACAAASRSAGA